MMLPAGGVLAVPRFGVGPQYPAQIPPCAAIDRCIHQALRRPSVRIHP